MYAVTHAHTQLHAAKHLRVKLLLPLKGTRFFYVHALSSLHMARFSLFCFSLTPHPKPRALPRGYVCVSTH